MGRLSILDLIHTSCVPCSGLVKKSPRILCVGQYAIFSSPFLILSVKKIYLMFRCLVCLLFDAFPFSASSIVLLLSWYIVVVGMCSPCAARKCLDHSICHIESSIATNSASVELFVFNFCLLDVEYTVPFTRIIKIPLCILMSGCTEYELSTHQFGSSTASIVSVMSLVLCMYLITLASFL